MALFFPATPLEPQLILWHQLSVVAVTSVIHWEMDGLDRLDGLLSHNSPPKLDRVTDTNEVKHYRLFILLLFSFCYLLPLLPFFSPFQGFDMKTRDTKLLCSVLNFFLHY